MVRDVKPRKRAGTRRGSGGGTLFGLFVGLLVGVFLAAGVVWYIYRTPPPFTTKTQTASNIPQPGEAPLILPGKPGDSVPPESDRPRFDFYKILPGGNEMPSGSGSHPKPELAKQDANRPDTKPADIAREQQVLRDPVFLQTGSFQNAADADNQKARLAMSGMEAFIQQVMLQDKVWYRVRLGPFRKLEDVNVLRADLARQGIESNIVRKD